MNTHFSFRWQAAVILTIGLAISSIILIQAVRAANPFDIQYPVEELGNCGSQQECKAYCDDANHADACLNFARSKGLAPKESEEEVKLREAVASGNGPGGCKNQKECELYCNDISHIDSCIAFAEEKGFMKGKELEEAKKVRDIVKQGVQMPGGCKNKKECDAFCSEPDNMETCIAFAERAGFMNKEELDEAKKMLPLMKSGAMPGGCRGKEACEAYCADESHFEECVSFSEKAGLMSSEDAARARKTGGKGPGGCRGRECEGYCENPANRQVCVKFAKENGLLSEEDLQRMEEGQQEMRRALENAPPAVQGCLEQVLGGKTVDQDFIGGPEVGEKMRSCFEQFHTEQDRKRGSGPGYVGPGGCKSQEECDAFCSQEANRSQCPSGSEERPQEGFSEERRPEKMMPPINAGEMRYPAQQCNSPEECQRMYEQRPNEGFPDRRSESPMDQIREGFQQPPQGMMPPQGIIPEQFQKEGIEFQPPEGFISPERLAPLPPTSVRYLPKRQSLVGSVLEILNSF